MEAVRLFRGYVTRYYVDLDACKACGICYNLIACPAIVPLENRKAWIDPNMCVAAPSAPRYAHTMQLSQRAMLRTG